MSAPTLEPDSPTLRLSFTHPDHDEEHSNSDCSSTCSSPEQSPLVLKLAAHPIVTISTPKKLQQAVLRGTTTLTTDPTKPLLFTLYTRRWLVLFIFSSLAFLNNVICYTFASIHHVARKYYTDPAQPANTPHLADLVSTFFLTYVIFSLPSSWFIDRFGLKAGVILGSYLAAIGTGMRCLVTHPNEFSILYAGQIIASLGQAFFVNSPPKLAALWFGADERTFATTIAVNANTLGVAGAYILGPLLVNDTTDVLLYLRVIFYCSALFALISTVMFPAMPPTPPSLSQLSLLQRVNSANSTTSTTNGTNLGSNSNGHNGHSQSSEPNSAITHHSASNITSNNSNSSFLKSTNSHSHTHHHDRHSLSLRSIWSLFRQSGFSHTVLAFSLAEATINGFSAFMNSILIPRGFDNVFIGIVAVLLIVMCMVGSAVFGFIVDRYRCYKLILIISFFGGALSTVAFMKSETAVEVVASVAVLGSFIGPMQPVALESAVECTYPSSASTVTAVLQMVGNLASAALFPVMLALRGEGGSMMKALWLLAVAQAVVGLFYMTFTGAYLRLAHEASGHHHHHHSHSKHQRSQESSANEEQLLLKKKPKHVVHSQNGLHTENRYAAYGSL